MKRFQSIATSLSLITLTIALCSVLVSCGEQQSEEQIIIGHQADLTGAIASWGYWLDKAAKSAVDQVNKEGGIAGRQVKYVVEDTETNPATGARKFRKLVLQHKADFVIGSVHSGIMLATNPIAKELKTVYAPVGMASEGTAEKGNRYVFRINSHVREQVEAAAEWVVENVAKKWTICVSDYAWGSSHEEWFSREVEEAGGQILASFRIPQGTKDFMPYLAKIPKETEGIYSIFFGADSIGFIQQLHESGYKGQKYTVVCTLEAIDIAKLGPAAEGTWVLEYLPRILNQTNVNPELLRTFDTEYHRNFRKVLGVDDAGKETNNPDRVMACSHCWATYELVFMLKKGIEQSGWKSKEDNPKLIQALEGIKLEWGQEHPQGPKTIRPEDHQGFHQHWMSHVENGKLVVKFNIPVEEVMYEPPVDYRKEEF